MKRPILSGEVDCEMTKEYLTVNDLGGRIGDRALDAEKYASVAAAGRWDAADCVDNARTKCCMVGTQKKEGDLW